MNLFRKLCIALTLIMVSATYASDISKETFRVYCAAQTAPFSYIDVDWKKPKGFEVDLFYELQNRLGFKINEDRIIPIPQDLLGDFIDDGLSDISFGAISATYAREKHFNMSNVYCQSSLGIIRATGNTDVTTLYSLKGKRIAVVQDSDGLHYVQSVLQNAQIIQVPNLTLGLFKVHIKEADALVADRMILKHFVNTGSNLGLEVTDDVFDMDSGRIALELGKDFKYKKEIDDELTRMKNDGTIYKLMEKWGMKASFY